jgi:hypothetical protein
VHAGQIVQYLIVNTGTRWPYKKIIAAQLLGTDVRYDVGEYVELLFSAGETLLGVFGYDKHRIETQVIRHEKRALFAFQDFHIGENCGKRENR